MTSALNRGHIKRRCPPSADGNMGGIGRIYAVGGGIFGGVEVESAIGRC